MHWDDGWNDGAGWWWLFMLLMMTVFWGGLAWIIVTLVRHDSRRVARSSRTESTDR